ncbi:MAG: lysine exporter LysO family protein, partial [Marinilabiliaceae bacterium]
MISLTVIALFIAGIAIGFPLRGRTSILKIADHLVITAVFALLFFLGISVGTDPRIINNIASLGWQAAAISGGAIAGSLLLAKLVAYFFHQQENEGPSDSEKQTRPHKGWPYILKKIGKSHSLWILIIFVTGTMGAFYELFPEKWGNDEVATSVLYVMMVLVGASIGADPRSREILKKTRFHILLVPLLVIIGSLTGSLLVALLLRDMDIANGMAIGAGFGYYSLSAIFIGQISGSEMGVVALLANIIREVFTLMAAPFLVRWFGKLAAIASGGATAMDTTLPVIVKATGKDYAIISIFSGVVLSILVPVLVPLILGQ